MKKTLVTILIVVALVLALGVAGACGYLWYQNNHVFVEGDAYAVNLLDIDLTGEDISVAYYDQLREKLTECNIRWMVPFHGGKYANDTESLTVSELTLEDVEFIAQYFPDLKSLDASQCDQYDVLVVAEAMLPDCELTYYVNLGHPSQMPHYQSEYLQMGFGELLAGEPDYDFDALMQNLVYLPELKQITMENVVYSLEQVESLRAAYPEVEILATVEVFGQQYDLETTELDLSGMTGEDAVEVAEQLKQLPNLVRVNLNPENGIGALSLEDVKKLMDAVPDVVFDFTFDFYGHTLSTADEEVHIKNTKIGDEGEQNVRNALDLMKNCKRFVLENCQISNEILAQIRDDYRDQTKVVWRIQFGRGTTMTDAQIIRAVYDLSNTNCKDLVYCEDARFVDFGHNGDDGNYLRDCSYVAGMPNLEAIILSSAYITDLSAFENCKNLKMLEIAFCGMVTDISPLAGCESLEMLNISFTGVTDLSPLDNLPIKYLCAMNYSANRVSKEEQDRFQSLHPDCWSQYVGEQPYGPGWRYTEDGKDYLPYYQLLRDVFQYEIYPNTPNHVGWYLGEEEYASIAEYEAAVAPSAAADEEMPAEETVEETTPEE